MMKMRYDKEADAAYITFQEGTFAKNKQLDDLTIMDLDADDHILGIEFLNASERLPVESFADEEA